MKLRINGQAIEVAERSTVLQATWLAGVEVPTLCHDDRPEILQVKIRRQFLAAAHRPST